MDSYTIDVDSNLYTAMADIAAEYDITPSGLVQMALEIFVNAHYALRPKMLAARQMAFDAAYKQLFSDDKKASSQTGSCKSAVARISPEGGKQ